MYVTLKPGCEKDQRDSGSLEECRQSGSPDSWCVLCVCACVSITAHVFYVCVCSCMVCAWHVYMCPFICV